MCVCFYRSYFTNFCFADILCKPSFFLSSIVATSKISITKINPNNSLWFEDTFNFIHENPKFLKIVMVCVFQSPLPIPSVISHLPVWWRSDYTINSFIRKSFYHAKGISMNYFISVLIYRFHKERKQPSLAWLLLIKSEY